VNTNFQRFGKYRGQTIDRRSEGHEIGAELRVDGLACIRFDCGLGRGKDWRVRAIGAPNHAHCGSAMRARSTSSPALRAAAWTGVRPGAGRPEQSLVGRLIGATLLLLFSAATTAE